jgi:hypothetical protein
MGEVYLARDHELHRTVAVKVLPADVTADPQRVERFEREARAVAALNHPHICQLYDVGPNYLVMEFVDGAPIRPPDDAAYVPAVARALGHAGLGQVDEAFALLERAVDAHEAWLTVSRTSFPTLDDLRPDPRFAALRRRIGLT